MMKLKLRRTGMWGLCLALAVMLGACGQQAQQAVATPEPAKVEPPASKPEPEPKPLPYTAPLTGLGSETPVDQRVIGVMVNNYQAAVPQTGLDQADMFYEVLAEGSITRIVALYQSHAPEMVGPIRSVRPYYIDILEGFDAVIAHAGGSTEALTVLAKKKYPHLDEIYGAGAYFWRESFRKPPHNLYSSIAKLRKGIEDKGYRTQAQQPRIQFVNPDQPAEGETANAVHIQFDSKYHISFEYDPEEKVYKRFEFDKPHTDLATGKQLTATNILVVKAKHQILDKELRRAVDVYGPGEGYLFERGKVRPIEWKRVDGMIRPYIDGLEAGYYPGQTWVEVIPTTGSDVTYE
jgi:hypothetical protein